MKEAIHFCIICGRKFRSTSPKVVFCSSCSGLTLHTGSFGAEAEVPEEWQVGDLILGLYEVKEIFSTGGMGLVYRVHHRLWNIDLAVKSPRPALFQTEEQKQVFLAEAETWVSLGLHPHVVTCFYVRTLGGIPRIFAEFVEGGSLKDWIRTRRLYEGGPKEALRRILDLAIQFAWGLDYAHQKGVVHQDVKPANALLTSEGLLKVTDFGLVKAKGFSPAYAAPEQVLGKPVGPWTDLWGWGMSVLEMFTGEVTWMEGTAAPAVLEAYLQDPPEGLPPMPQGVVEILRACFQEDPRARPQGMAEVAEQLRAVYEAEMGEPYSRAKPEALALQADSLNNRAVSYLDLGKEEEAVQCWQEALKADPMHLEANFNYGYYRWQRAELLGSEFLRQIQHLESAHGGNAAYWRQLGWVYLEQGYVEEVEEVLRKLKGLGVREEVLEQAHRAPDRPVIREVQRFIGKGAHVVNSVAWSPDGYFVISGGNDRLIRVWDLKGREVGQFFGHTDWVTSVVFSPDGHYVLSGSVDRTIRLWDMKSKQEVKRLEGHTDSIWSVVFSPDGRYALSGSSDTTVRLWDIEKGQEIQRLEGHTDAVRSVAFSPDGRYALSGGADKTARLWDLMKGQEICCLKVHTDKIRFVAFSPKGSYVLLGGQLWEASQWREIHQFEKQGDVILSGAFSPDEQYVLLGTNNCIQVREVNTGREIRRLYISSSIYCDVLSIAFSPDGRYALSGGFDRIIRMWEIFPTCFKDVRIFPTLTRVRSSLVIEQEQFHFLKLLKQAQQEITEGNCSQAYFLLRQAQETKGYERDSRILLQIARCGLTRGRRIGLLNAWQVRCFRGHNEEINSVAFSPDGHYALSGSSDETVRLWETETGLEICRFEGHTGPVYAVAFSPDGRYAVSAGDMTVRLWEVATGQEIYCFKGHKSWVYSAAFSPDGHYVVSGGDDSAIKVWEIKTGQEMICFQRHAEIMRSVAVSPDGCYVVGGSVGPFGGNNTVQLWDIRQRRLIWRSEEHALMVSSVAFSPDGLYILSGSADKTIRLWDVESGLDIYYLLGHVNWVSSVAFSPDGQYAVSGSFDKSIRLWKLEPGRTIYQLIGHTESVLSVTFSPDGRYVLSGSADKTIRLWELDWEWEFPEPADWDEGARPYLEIFLKLHTPYGPDGLSRAGPPQWTEEDFQKLLHELGLRGFGWLRPEGVRRELEKMAAQKMKP